MKMKQFWSQCLTDQYKWMLEHGRDEFGYIQFYSVLCGRPVQEAVEIYRADCIEMGRLWKKYTENFRSVEDIKNWVPGYIPQF